MTLMVALLNGKGLPDAMLDASAGAKAVPAESVGHGSAASVFHAPASAARRARDPGQNGGHTSVAPRNDASAGVEMVKKLNPQEPSVAVGPHRDSAEGVLRASHLPSGDAYATLHAAVPIRAVVSGVNAWEASERRTTTVGPVVFRANGTATDPAAAVRLGAGRSDHRDCTAATMHEP